MTKLYNGLGLTCMYPENWSLSEDTDEGKTISFTVESPTSAFMTVSEYPWSVSPQQAIERGREAMQAEYEDTEVEVFSPQLSYRGGGMQQCLGTDIRFYYLDLLVISRLIAFTIEKRTFLIQIQGEDRDFESLEKVFQAMLISMLKSLE